MLEKLEKGCQRLRQSEDFNRVHCHGLVWRRKSLTLKANASQQDCSRLGIVVSRKIGSSVIRNKVKRTLREIFRQLRVKPGWDIVVVTRPSVKEMDYNDVKTMVISLLAEADLLEENP
jgi:ribonuclease P protein component